MTKFKSTCILAASFSLGLVAISCETEDSIDQSREVAAEAQEAPEASDDEAQAFAAVTSYGCPSDHVELGKYATWCGKVNVHTVGTSWFVDSDCSSGCLQNTVAYCQKFYPAATLQAAFSTVSSTVKPFATAGCSVNTPSVGQNEYACCRQGLSCTWDGQTYPHGSATTGGARCSSKFDGFCIGGIFAGAACVASGECYAHCDDGTWTRNGE